jgi:hypothetical protein
MTTVCLLRGYQYVKGGGFVEIGRLLRNAGKHFRRTNFIRSREKPEGQWLSLSS